MHQTQLKHTYAQLIDDTRGATLAAAATTEPSLKTEVKYGGNKAAAAFIGKLVAERAIMPASSKFASTAVAPKYHGRVAALAEAAREAGLSF